MLARKCSQNRVKVLLLGSEAMLGSNAVEALCCGAVELTVTVDSQRAQEIAQSGSVDFLLIDFDLYCREFWQFISETSSEESGCRVIVLVHSFEQLARATQALVDGILMTPLDAHLAGALTRKILVPQARRRGAARRNPHARSFGVAGNRGMVRRGSV